MEIQNKKCSLNEHKEINSNSFCLECKIYMCNKCENHHSQLFPNHQTFNSEKDIYEIFTGFCKEADHLKELEFFCKKHNQLCCGMCIAKIKKKEIGKHKDCEVCTIEEIKDEKRNKIKDNIKYLKELSNTLQKSVEELKEIFEKINENKEKIKLKVQSVFTKIRNELNNREDTLLLEIDKQYNDNYSNEKIVKDTEKLPEKIKLLLEKVENIDKEYNDDKLSLFINDCINVEDNIQNIMKINENIKKYNKINNQKIRFVPENEESINKFLENIKKFGEINKDSFKEINNPWTSIRFKNENVFYYTLKENDYVAEKTENDSFIHLIKSSYQFKKDVIYKLEYIVNYINGGDIDIGFADFSISNNYYWLRDYKNCVAISNKGLHINSIIVNKNLTIKNGKKFEFIIDMSKKKFILNIDNNKSGEFSFNFEENIYAQAAIRKIGNSVKIKTYEK